MRPLHSPKCQSMISSLMLKLSFVENLLQIMSNTSQATKLLLDYILANSRKSLIPDIPTIQRELLHLLRMSENYSMETKKHI